MYDENMLTLLSDLGLVLISPKLLFLSLCEP